MSFVDFVLSFLRVRSAYAELGDTADRMEWKWPVNRPVLYDREET